MSSLPHEIIEGILSSLPVKSLVRFRCVSKSWLELISDPVFINTHLKQVNLSNNVKMMLKSDYFYSVDNVDIVDCNLVVNLNRPFETTIRGAEILGSCNGLLCILLTEGVIGLWNPSTRERKKLPDCPFEFSGSYFPTSYGFGYDSITDDYKVVVVDSYEDDDIVRHAKANVYSLAFNSWKVIPDIPYEFISRTGHLINGALHWVAVRCNALDESFLIISFGIGDDEFQEVSLPEFKNGKVWMNVAVLAGCLCILRYCTLHLEVWVMKNYGARESWTMFFSIGQPVYNQPMVYNPLCILKNGEILLDKGGESLILYDPKDGKVRSIGINGLSKWHETEIYVGSLVTLNSREIQGNGRIGEEGPRAKTVIIDIPNEREKCPSISGEMDEVSLAKGKVGGDCGFDSCWSQVVGFFSRKMKGRSCCRRLEGCSDANKCVGIFAWDWQR